MLHLVSGRTDRPADDPIFALNAEATARKAKGESIVNATVGALLDDEGKLLVLPSSARAVREVPEQEWAAYAPIAGTSEFANAVIADLFSTEPELKASAIAVATPGGTGALRHAIANFLEAGQSLLTTSYFWGPYQTLTDEADRKLDTFSMFTAGGEFNVAALDEKIGEHLRSQKRVLLFINDPCHNPTGYSMAQSEWKSVIDVLLKRANEGPITLLVDTAYFDYASGDPRAFLKSLVPLVGKVGLLFAWSASKSFTHYGLRVGALVACVDGESDRKRTHAAFSYSSRGSWSNCNRGGLSAVTRLLTDPALSASCKKEREAARALLGARVAAFNRAAHGVLRYPRYEGGFFVTVFSEGAHEKANRMKDAGVFVVPQKGALRVALCSVAERDVKRLVEAFAI